MLENIKVEKGRVFIIPQANRSATTLGMLGNAYPTHYKVETDWGTVEYKNGDRWGEPAGFVAGPVHLQALSF